MMKKLLIILIGLTIATPVFAAPYFRQEAGLVPITDSTYYLGTTTPSLKAWLNIITDEICLAGSCRTTWPSGGGGGSGNVATSSAETNTYVPFWTSTGATPAELSGGVAGFIFDSTLTKLTVTNLQSTNSTSTNATSTNLFGGLFTANSLRIGGSASTTISSAGSLAIPTGANLTVTDLTSALTLTGAGGIFAEYTGTTCTNQFVRVLSALGVATCATVGTADVSGLDISDDTNLAATWPVILTGDTLTFGGLSTTTALTTGRVPYVSGVNTFADVATSSLVQSTGVNIANGTTAYVLGAQPTFTVDQAFTPTWTGAHIFDSITRSTTTSATSTNFFSTTASTTNFYGGGLTTCQTNNVLTYDGAGRFGCEADDSGSGSPDSKWATTTSALNPNAIFPNGTANTLVGIGTSTPMYQLTIASSTGPQLSLSDSAGFAQWAFRNAGGNFYLSTTTIAGTATSTRSIFSIIKGGLTGLFGFGTSTPTTQIDIYSNATTTLKLDSDSASQGACLELKDRDGSGYTYLYVNNGVMFSSTISCK